MSCRAIVTGAARGIGRAIALRLAADARERGGARLVLADQHAGELEGLAAELRVHGADVTPVAGDLADAATVDRIAQAAQAFGGLDALASNAGFSIPGTLLEYRAADWDQVFAVHVRSPWLLARACHPLLRAARGSIVFTTSISGTHATVPLGAYSPSKAAALMLMRQLAAEWAPDGIRTNAVSPGLTVTPGTAAAYSRAEARAQRSGRVPLRRLAEPQEIASVVAFLLGPDAAYVNGAELVADGGLTQTLMSSLDMTGWRAASSN